MVRVRCVGCEKQLICKISDREYPDPSNGRKSRATSNVLETLEKFPLCQQRRALVFEPELAAVYIPPGPFNQEWWPAMAMRFYVCPRNPAQQNMRSFKIQTLEERRAEMLDTKADDPALAYLIALLEPGPLSADYVKEIWKQTPWSSRMLNTAIRELNVTRVNGCLTLDPSE